jgi:hypothetical protein
MTTPELYYLLFVLISFGSFAVALIIATLQYKRWIRARAPQTQTIAYTAASNDSNAEMARAS